MLGEYMSMTNTIELAICEDVSRVLCASNGSEAPIDSG
jgi:hypothetical protein